VASACVCRHLSTANVRTSRTSRTWSSWKGISRTDFARRAWQAATSCCTRRPFVGAALGGRSVTSHRANVDATSTCLASGCWMKRVSSRSSSAYVTRRRFQTRANATAPLSPYALQKLIGEEYGQLFTALYGFRPPHRYSTCSVTADPSSPYSGVISLFIRAWPRAPATIFGMGADARFHVLANVSMASCAPAAPRRLADRSSTWRPVVACHSTRCTQRCETCCRRVSSLNTPRPPGTSAIPGGHHASPTVLGYEPCAV